MRSRRIVTLGSARVDYSGSRWWWTVASFGVCRRCGSHVDRAIIANDSDTRSVLCAACADETGIARRCVESKRARQLRHQRLISDYSMLGGTAA